MASNGEAFRLLWATQPFNPGAFHANRHQKCKEWHGFGSLLAEDRPYWRQIVWTPSRGAIHTAPYEHLSCQNSHPTACRPVADIRLRSDENLRAHHLKIHNAKRRTKFTVIEIVYRHKQSSNRYVHSSATGIAYFDLGFKMSQKSERLIAHEHVVAHLLPTDVHDQLVALSPLEEEAEILSHRQERFLIGGRAAELRA